MNNETLGYRVVSLLPSGKFLTPNPFFLSERQNEETDPDEINSMRPYEFYKTREEAEAYKQWLESIDDSDEEYFVVMCLGNQVSETEMENVEYLDL